MNRPNTPPRTFVPTRRTPPTPADASGPLPQFSLEDARLTLALEPLASAPSPATAEDAFDQAPTLVRPALDPAQAAAVLRAIERRRAPGLVAAPVIEEFDADALVDASGAHAPPAAPRHGDTIAPVMSTSEIRFFDADAAVLALEDQDDRDLDSALPQPAPGLARRARLARRAVFAVVGVAGLVLSVGAGVSAARPSESSSVVEEIYALARADASSSRDLQAARAAAATPIASEVIATPSTGTFETTKELAAQTLFVDGIAMGRAPLTLACGRHGVRVGRGGVARSLEVPCGGSVVAR